ncbi:MAG TPA: type II secretion system protein GspK [Desulfobacteraceae bacterium]|nr:type II secretion system protein GspK [Desulfobacteraceae bacterium]HPJ66894.1 type II secretion system protein GspK [Desulfobacteraceae bacterium]HPQ27647.1 type II secretion system protein GspK [Desulfobacteraceae bacterium]
MAGLLKNKQGFALILTVMIISLIVALTLKFNKSMRSELGAAARLRDGIATGCIAESGFNCAIAVLSEDASKNDYDSLTEPWAYSSAVSHNSSLMFEDGRFELEILDLSGRIQINQLIDKSGNYNPEQKELLTRFLYNEQFDLESEEVDDLIDAIKDWIDPDNEITGFGAENSYYQALDKPYPCGNAPFLFLEDMLYVRGMTERLYYGTEEKPGVSYYLTVHGDGRININTADQLVLKCLSEEIDSEMVEGIVEYRMNEDMDINEPTWYNNVPGMRHIVINPEIITTLSTYFKISSLGIKDHVNKQITGIVKRNDRTVKILSWKKE